MEHLFHLDHWMQVSPILEHLWLWLKMRGAVVDSGISSAAPMSRELPSIEDELELNKGVQVRDAALAILAWGLAVVFLNHLT